MSRLLEHHTKLLLQEAAIRVPRGVVADDPVQAAEFARTASNGVVIKALVAANRRAKTGLVVFATDSDEVPKKVVTMLRALHDGMPIESVLIEEALSIERELYFAIVIDSDIGSVKAIGSLLGGVDIERTAAEKPDAIRTVELTYGRRIPPSVFRGLWTSLGLPSEQLLTVSDACARAAQLFFDSDATLLELNPLALVRVADAPAPVAVAVGALMAVDDNAHARQPRLREWAVPRGAWRPPTELERAALDVADFEPYRGTARFLELDGDIGLLVGGGGGSLVLFDAVQRAGGRPACYTEIGGNPSAEKVRRLTRVVLGCRGIRALLVAHNITNNTQVDLVARGVADALRDAAIDPARFPVVAREIGTNDVVGRQIFEAAGIEYLDDTVTMDEAARRIVIRANERDSAAK